MNNKRQYRYKRKASYTSMIPELEETTYYYALGYMRALQSRSALLDNFQLSLDKICKDYTRVNGDTDQPAFIINDEELTIAEIKKSFRDSQLPMYIVDIAFARSNNGAINYNVVTDDVFRNAREMNEWHGGKWNIYIWINSLVSE
jgi:hypothetical protein